MPHRPRHAARRAVAGGSGRGHPPPSCPAAARGRSRPAARSSAMIANRSGTLTAMIVHQSAIRVRDCRRVPPLRSHAQISGGAFGAVPGEGEARSVRAHARPTRAARAADDARRLAIHAEAIAVCVAREIEDGEQRLAIRRPERRIGGRGRFPRTDAAIDVAGKIRRLATRRRDDVEVVILSRASAGVAVVVVGDPRAVRRPRRPLADARAPRQLTQIATIRVARVDVPDPFEVPLFPSCRHEGEARAVRRPGGREVVPLAIGDLPRRAARHIHDEEVPEAVADVAAAIEKGPQAAGDAGRILRSASAV